MFKFQKDKTWEWLYSDGLIKYLDTLTERLDFTFLDIFIHLSKNVNFLFKQSFPPVMAEILP